VLLRFPTPALKTMIFRKIVVLLESFVVLMGRFFLLIFGTFVRIYIFTSKELEDVVNF
jgi:hypothetical protein